MCPEWELCTMQRVSTASPGLICGPIHVLLQRATVLLSRLIGAESDRFEPRRATGTRASGTERASARGAGASTSPVPLSRTHPGRHFVRVGAAVVVIEDEDGRHHRRRHHEHDTVEIRPCSVAVAPMDKNTQDTLVAPSQARGGGRGRVGAWFRGGWGVGRVLFLVERGARESWQEL